ncbi:MAG: hypothetical protein ABIJ97_01135, partial [Bacteroidota bacterium]
EMDIIVFGNENEYFGYFTSERPDGFGGKDIYSFKYIVEDSGDKNMIVENDSTIDPAEIIYEDDHNDPSSYFANVDDNISVNENNTDDNPNDINVTGNDKSGNSDITDNSDISDNSDKSGNTDITDNNDISDNSDKSGNSDITDNSDVNSNSTDNSTDNSTNKNKSYSADQGWKTEDMSSKNVVFRVQVGASRKTMPQNELKERYRGNLQVSEIFHEGWYKYLIGYYAKYADAKDLQSKCGTNDAWVVTQKDGIRIHIREILDSFAFNYRLENFLFL